MGHDRFLLFGCLTLVRVARVVERPVGLSRRPWGMRSDRGLLARRVKVLNVTRHPVAAWGLQAESLGQRPFPPSFSPFSLLSSSSRWGRLSLPFSDGLIVVAPASSCGAEERRRGARSRCSSHREGPSWIVLQLSPCSPPYCVHVCIVWASPRCSISAVYLPTDIATAVCVATSEEASLRLVVATRYPVATRCLSRCPSPSHYHRDGLVGRDNICLASGVFVAANGVSACAPRRALVSVLSGGVPGFRAMPCVPVLADGRPGGFRECSALKGLSRSKVFSISWDPHPRESVEGVSPSYERALVDSLMWWTLWLRGKRWCAEALICPFHYLALHWFRSHIGRVGVGLQIGCAAVVVVVLCCGSLASLYRGVTQLLFSVTRSLVSTVVAPMCSSLTSWSVQGPGWFCLWALNLVEVSGGRGCDETSLLTWLLGVSRGDTWLFLPDLVEVHTKFLLLWLVASFEAGSECELQECVAAVVGCACYERDCYFARATVGFVLGLHVRVGVSRRLREPTRGVAFTGAGLLPVDPSVLLLELSRCFVCRVAPLVERCDTCLWLLSGLCWLVVNSSEVLSEFFSVGSGESASLGCPVFWCSFPESLAVVLNGALVVLVEVLPEPVVLLPLAAVFSLLAVSFGRGMLCAFFLYFSWLLEWWCSAMAIGAVLRTMVTFVAK
ncbi:hypothetical protein Taro_047090, partial [Colocasia esculenta]|nr:hypothetical protein [Colocasia esculenta]